MMTQHMLAVYPDSVQGGRVVHGVPFGLLRQRGRLPAQHQPMHHAAQKT
jgi:hypothetical protein